MKRKIFHTSLLLILSIKISIILALLNSYFANFIWKKYYYGYSLDTYHTIFYSYPLLIGLLMTLYNPREFGLGLAQTFKNWKISLICTLIIIIPILVYFKTTAYSPFHSMSWQVFILAPLGEEIIFRGAFYTWINETLKDIIDNHEEVIILLSIVFSALAFGFWHIPNIIVEPTYTVSQISHTTFLGLIFGYLRYKTGSIYSSVIIHSIINFLATLT